MQRLLTLVFLLAGLQLGGPISATTLGSVPAGYRQIAQEIRLDGVVQAVNRSTMSAQTSGQVAEVLFDVDDYVSEGQIVIRLTDTEQQAAVRRARAELASAQARFEETRDNHRRITELVERKLGSQAQLDQAASAMKTAAAAISAARAALVQAEQQLQYTQVRAPYSGILTERLVEPGEAVQPGQPLVSGISLEQLRVEVEVPQTYIEAIRARQQAIIELPEGGTLNSTRVTVFPYALPNSNSFRVRVEMPALAKGLFPGMFVKLRFVVGERRALTVPAEAVAYRSEVSAVYVLNAQGQPRLRQIRTGRSLPDGQIEVLSGLVEGEAVALDPIAAAAVRKGQ